MGAIAFAPLVEHRQNLGDLLIEQAVHGHPTRPAVDQIGTPVLPTFDPPATDLEHLAHRVQGPALTDRVVHQGEQTSLPGVLRQRSCRISGFGSDHTVGVWLTRE